MMCAVMGYQDKAQANGGGLRVAQAMLRVVDEGEQKATEGGVGIAGIEGNGQC